MKPDTGTNRTYLNADQAIYLPKWARLAFLGLIGFLALTATASGLVFLFTQTHRDYVAPIMSIAQAAAGAFAIVLFVLFAERQLNHSRLEEKSRVLLDELLPRILSRIELPQISKDQTVNVERILRPEGIFGSRKDIYGSTYRLQLNEFQLKLWVGVNVRRLSVIYFVNASNKSELERIEEIFKYTFGGASKLGYHVNFEYATIEDESVVSIWSTVMTDNEILSNPAEQLFWMQDIAMMTQSFARTALRNGICAHTATDPGPL